MSASEPDTQNEPASQAREQSPFHRAVIYWKTEKKPSKPRDAWIWISTSLRWIEIRSQCAQAPEKLELFRGQNRLALERLSDTTEWEDVKAAVRTFKPERETGYALEVSGKVTLRHSVSLRNPKVELVVILQDEKTRDALVVSLLIRISPWKLLYASLKNEELGSDLSQNVLTFAVYQFGDYLSIYE